MLIQSFIEKSIFQGYSGTSDDYHLEMKFSYIDLSILKYIITDNGFGRSESMKKKELFSEDERVS